MTCAVYKICLDHALVILDSCFIYLDFGKLSHALEHIGQMAQYLFLVLGRGIAHLGEGTERGDIGEIFIFPETAHIEGVRLTV